MLVLMFLHFSFSFLSSTSNPPHLPKVHKASSPNLEDSWGNASYQVRGIDWLRHSSLSLSALICTVGILLPMPYGGVSSALWILNMRESLECRVLSEFETLPCFISLVQKFSWAPSCPANQPNQFPHSSASVLSKHCSANSDQSAFVGKGNSVAVFLFATVQCAWAGVGFPWVRKVELGWEEGIRSLW